MDFYLQKAKLFALETAKKSQEIATQAAILSQELATETAKRSKELAVDVTKKADQLKVYAGELTPSIVTSKGSGAPPIPSEAELKEYGISPELREFVKGLTIKTFKDFPIEGSDGGFKAEPGTEQEGFQIEKQDLTPWRERHAVLVLLSVKAISDFRYVLCPRRMNESRFWKIYFTLVKPKISDYETRAKEKEVALAEEVESKRISQQQAGGLNETRDLRSAPTPAKNADHDLDAFLMGAADSGDERADHDLDAYLMGAPDSSDEGAGDGDDDDGFDEDFDQLVSSAADSDGEEASNTASSNNGKKAIRSTESSAPKPITASNVSSDEEIPDNESELVMVDKPL